MGQDFSEIIDTDEFAKFTEEIFSKSITADDIKRALKKINVCVDDINIEESWEGNIKTQVVNVELSKRTFLPGSNRR